LEFYYRLSIYFPIIYRKTNLILWFLRNMNGFLYAAVGRKVAFPANPFFICHKITTLGLNQMRHA